MALTISVTLKYTVKRARTMKNPRDAKFIADLRADATALKIPTPRQHSMECVEDKSVRFSWTSMSESAVRAPRATPALEIDRRR